MTTFHQTRLTLRAVLVSALLILGHVLLTTAAANSTSSSTPLSTSLAPALKTTSALIFLTILWISFTLLEAVDIGLSGLSILHQNGDEEGVVFERTWVEFGLNSILLASWAAHIGEITLIMDTFSPSIASELVLIPIAFAIALASLASLQAQLVYTISHHAYTFGIRSLLNKTFWNRKTGHWTDRITLGEAPLSVQDISPGMLEEKVLEDVRHEVEPDVWSRVGQKMGQAVVLALRRR